MARQRGEGKGWIYALTLNSVTKIGCTRKADPSSRAFGAHRKLHRGGKLVRFQAVPVKRFLFQVEWRVQSELKEFRVRGERFCLPNDVLAQFPALVKGAVETIETVRRQREAGVSVRDIYTLYGVRASTVAKVCLEK
jgi:hypothetical protein